jgi:hypothetical protein
MPQSQSSGRSLTPPETDRPHMPGYGITTDRQGLLSWNEAEKRLVQAHNYWLSTTRPDGRPHAAPLWGVWHDGAFYFGTGTDSRKGRNLAHNPAAVLHLESGDDVLILEGTVAVTDDPAVCDPVRTLYSAKYQLPAGDIGESFYVLRPQVAFAWLEPTFPTTATRWQFAA